MIRWILPELERHFEAAEARFRSVYGRPSEDTDADVERFLELMTPEAKRAYLRHLHAERVAAPLEA